MSSTPPVARAIGTVPYFAGDLLHKSARLERARHHDHIGAGIHQMRKLVVESQLEMYVRVVVQMQFQMPEVTGDLRVGSGAQQHELRTLGHRVEDRMMDQPDTFLMIEAPDIGDDWVLGTSRNMKRSRSAPGIDTFLVDRRRRISVRDPAIDFRVPRVVVDAVEDPVELGAVHVERVSKPGALIGVAPPPTRNAATPWSRSSSTRFRP